MQAPGVTKVRAADVLTIPGRASYPKRVASKPRVLTVPGAFSRRGLGPCVAPSKNLYADPAVKRRTQQSRKERAQTMRRNSLLLQNVSHNGYDGSYSRRNPHHSATGSIVKQERKGRMGNNTSKNNANQIVTRQPAIEEQNTSRGYKERGNVRQKMYLSGRHTRKRLDDAISGVKKARQLQVKYKFKLGKLGEELEAVSEKIAKRDLEQRVLLKLIRKISDRLLTPVTHREEKSNNGNDDEAVMQDDIESLGSDFRPMPAPVVVPSEPSFAPPPVPRKDEKLLNKYRSSFYN